VSVVNYPYIRDVLTIGPHVQNYYDAYVGAGPAFLIGREVRHEPGFRLIIRSIPLVIVADLYDGNGGVIDARGNDSFAVGARGLHGQFPNPATVFDRTTGFDVPIAPGGDGTDGGVGGAGGNGGTVTVYCRRSVNAFITVAGGRGAQGGAGGNGSSGVHGINIPAHTELVDQTPDDPLDFDFVQVEVPELTIPGTLGGNGGAGGTGGPGGQGGVITFTSIVDDTTPSFSAHGGEGGPGGPGGMAGAPGAHASGPDTVAGPEGQPGAEGAAGPPPNHVNVSEEQYVAGLRPLLDGFGPSHANHWAPHRILVAEYFYRRHNPAIPDQADLSRQAAVELARALELQPDNADALRLQAQLVGTPRVDETTGEVTWVGGGNNALGLPPDFDVVPRFADYIAPFTAFGDQVLTFLEVGAEALLVDKTLEALRGIVELQTADARMAALNITGDLHVAQTERQLAVDEANFTDQQLQQTTQEIRNALAEMENKPFSIGNVIGTMAEVAVAVVGVAVAVGTGGAALVALVPAVVALADQAQPVAKALFAGNSADTEKVEKAYEKVDKKASAVIGAGKNIVNFVSVVQRLTASTTPDNAKHVALVKRGTELAHQVLLANHKVVLADQRLDNVRAKLSRAEAVVRHGEALQAEIKHDVESVRRAGLLAISVAQSRADTLLDMAFRAQRSVEIYTLQPQQRNLHLDAGLLHPDRWREYQESEFDSPQLHFLLIQSWERLLQPIQMQSDYLSFFTPPPDQDLLRLSFEGEDPQLAALRATGRFSFRVEATAIPEGRHDAKVQSVGVALVGATHPDQEVSCEIRHGGSYEQRRAGGFIDVQLLKAHTSTRRAKLVPLSTDDVFTTDGPLDAPQSLAYWGRGIGGEWDVSVVREPANRGLDLSGLSRIQVWIGYQFRR
jgi:hypothetical protein